MKRQHHLSEKSSSSKSNSQISNEHEPIPKRPRMFIPSPTSPIDSENQIDEDEEDEIIIDEPLLPSMIIYEDNFSHNEHDSDDDIIEIEQENFQRHIGQTDDVVIVVSDSDSSDDNNDDDGDDDDSDDQGIDVTDDILPSVSSIMNPSIYSSDIDDVEIIQEEFDLNNEVNELRSSETNDDNDDRDSLEIITYNDQHHGNELIDLTEDELISISYSPVASERKLSIDAQQCPICLETLSQLQGSGVYLTITRCRHVMCALCSRQLLATSSRCPLCRENLNATAIMPYYILT